MEPRLTEFSYGYCVTQELANGAGPGFKAAPYFPSLYTEGQPGGGFDVQIGSALFLQFKLSDELTRRTAKETKKGLLEPTFFRFWLHRRDRSSQHRMLVELESVAGNQVFYIAPAFADINALDVAYSNGTVVARSAMFSPTDIGLLTDDQYHSVAFRPAEGSGWFLSVPKQVKVHSRRELVESDLIAGVGLSTPEGHAWLSGLVARMKVIIQQNTSRLPNLSRLPHSERGEGALEDAAYLARTHFGCELFLFATPR